MQIERPPYWVPQFDRWNLLGAILLLLVFVLATLRGCGAPQPTQMIPTITQPVAGANLNYAAPGAIVGKAAPGAKVRVFDGDQLLGETTADQAGFFRFSLPTLAPGPHTLTVRVYDASGKLLASSAPIAVNVSGGPAATASPVPSPQVGAATATLAAVKPTVQPPVFAGQLAGAQLVGGTPITLTGTAAPGTLVRLFANDRQIGETRAGADGRWSLAAPALAAGAYTLVARSYGPDGVLLAESAPLQVTIIEAAAATAAAVARLTPGAPLTSTVAVTGTLTPITSTVTPTLTATPKPAPATPAFIGLLPGAILTTDAANVLAGTAEPGATVRVFDGDKLLGEAMADPEGRWKLTLPALVAGTHTLIARVFGPDGTLLVSSTPITVMVAAPTAVATPLPKPTATPSPTPTTGAVAPVLPPSGEPATLPAGAPVSLSGTAAPGTILRIYDGERLLGETVADADGQWRLDVGPLATGLHVFTARVFDAAGKLLTASTPLSLIIAPGTATPGVGAPSAASTPGATPEVTSPKPGAVLDASSPGYLEGKAAPGATVRIYDGDKLLAEVVTGLDGVWRVVLPLLAEGTHTFRVRVVGPDGLDTSTSIPLTVTVTKAPALAGATPPGPGPEGTKPKVAGLTPGAILRSSQPLLTGTAQPNSVVRIYDGVILLGETHANAQGVWYFVSPTPLAIGQHVLRVAFVDADGKEVYSDPIEITVAKDATGLKPPIFLPPVPKGPSSVGLLQGTAPPGTTVGVHDGAVLMGSVLAGPDGKWDYPLPSHTRMGTHQFSITATSPDGVVVYRSAPASVLVKAGGS